MTHESRKSAKLLMIRWRRPTVLNKDICWFSGLPITYPVSWRLECGAASSGTATLWRRPWESVLVRVRITSELEAAELWHREG